MVSVCLACYNGERYLREQIESILSQLNSEDELIISDDNSEDKTVEIINEFNDDRIILYHNNFRNHVKNFEFTLSKATGDYIFLSDQDDVWLPEKVSKMINHLSKYDMVISDCYVTDENLNIISGFFQKDIISLNKSILIRNLIKADNWVGCCTAYKKEIIKKSLPFPKSVYGHDIWVAIFSMLYGRVIFIEDKLIYFRRHQNNFSIQGGNDMILTRKSNSSFYRKISRRISLIINLFNHSILILFREINWRINQKFI